MPVQKEYGEEDYLLEISRLWNLLEQNRIPFERPGALAQKISRMEQKLAMDPKQYAVRLSVQSEEIRLFHQYFHGRDDHFYRRSLKGAWYSPCQRTADPVCLKRQPDYIWKPGSNPCRTCPHKENATLTDQDLFEHLTGAASTSTLRISALQADGSTWFLAFDLDGLKSSRSERLETALKLMRSIEKAGMHGLLEKSGAASGFHLWLFFETPQKAGRVVELGQMLVLQAILEEGLEDFGCFESLVPDGPPRKPGNPGRSIELPLQAGAARVGSTLFVGSDGKPFGDQWKALDSTPRILDAQIDAFLRRARQNGWRNLLAPALESNEGEENGKKETFDYAGSLFEEERPLHLLPENGLSQPLTLQIGAQIAIPAGQLSPALKARLLLMGSCWNPEYFGRQARFATGPHVLSLARLEKGMLYLPRGLLEELEEQLNRSKIEFVELEEQEKGLSLALSCTAELRKEQKMLLAALDKRRSGILEAATGAGKTVMGAALIARRQTATLVLVGSQEILQGWVRTLNAFLHFEEEEFETARMASRKYPGKIGVLQAGTNTLSGRVDVAMVPSLQNRPDLQQILNQYGMILFDECHHAASASAQKILSRAPARFRYGLSATPERNDGLSSLVYLQLGQVVSRFTSKQQMATQSFFRLVIPRFTSFCTDIETGDFMRIVQQASWDPLRNAMILDDAGQALQNGRTVLILTRLVDHARFLARWMERENPQAQVLVYAGDPKEKQDNAGRLQNLEKERPVVLTGTYSSIGEGFDFPGLDTLLLALPVRSSISISQAIGRIHRQTAGKSQVQVYDYVDPQIAMMETMYLARLSEYEKQGYTLQGQTANGSEPDRSPVAQPEGDPPYSQESAGSRGAGSMALASSRWLSRQIESVTDEKVAGRLHADWLKASQKIAIALPFLSKPELEVLLRLVSLLRRQNGKNAQPVRIDLFVETVDPLQKQRLQEAGIYLHCHERIVERFLIFDQSLVWYGKMLCPAPLEAVYRIASAQLADDLLSIRRREEVRLLQQAKEGNGR